MACANSVAVGEAWFFDLPCALQLCILSRLSPRERQLLALVCRGWRAAVCELVPYSCALPVASFSASRLSSASFSITEHKITATTRELFGQPVVDAVVVCLPLRVARAFERSFSTPSVCEFNPNFDADEAALTTWSRRAALALFNALAAHAPAMIPFLERLERRLKGDGSFAPHVLIRNLHVGGVDSVPASDNPLRRRLFHAPPPQLI